MRNLFLVTVFIFFQCAAAFPQFRVHRNNMFIEAKAQDSNSQLKYYEDGKSWLWACYHTKTIFTPPTDVSYKTDTTYWTETVVGDTIVEGRQAKKILVEDENGERISIGLEEDGVIYSYGGHPARRDSICFLPNMDFNLHAGDSVFYNSINYDTEFIFKVVNEEMINVCGIERRKLTLGKGIWLQGYWVEGIGADTQFFYMTPGPPMSSYDSYSYYMIKCFKDGECIFTADDFYASTDGIDDVSIADSDKNRVTDDSLYDLSGRKVTGTPRSGIYIKGGRKVLVK